MGGENVEPGSVVAQSIYSQFEQSEHGQGGGRPRQRRSPAVRDSATAAKETGPTAAASGPATKSGQSQCPTSAVATLSRHSDQANRLRSASGVLWPENSRCQAIAANTATAP